MNQKKRNSVNLTPRHGMMRMSITVNIPKLCITYRLVIKGQKNSLDGYSTTTPPTPSLKLTNQTFIFKINWNLEIGQILVHSAQNVVEEAANQEVLNPVKGKEMSSTLQFSPPTPLLLKE